MKAIASQYPGSVNLLRNLASAVEAELKGSIPRATGEDSSLDSNMKHLDIGSSATGGPDPLDGSKMSVEMSKALSPSMNTDSRRYREGSDRQRRSHSMLALDKLNNKLRASS
jgi:hypothetical protein